MALARVESEEWACHSAGSTAQTDRKQHTNRAVAGEHCGASLAHIAFAKKHTLKVALVADVLASQLLYRPTGVAAAMLLDM